MRWLRANRKAGLLALTALALQIVVSFGHVHLDGVHRSYPALTAIGSGAQTAPSLPAQHPGDDGPDYCAICATIFLAANSFVPQPPQLAVPFASQSIEHFDRVAVVFITPWRAPFQSRAPPVT